MSAEVPKWGWSVIAVLAVFNFWGIPYAVETPMLAALAIVFVGAGTLCFTVLGRMLYTGIVQAIRGV